MKLAVYLTALNQCFLVLTKVPGYVKMFKGSWVKGIWEPSEPSLQFFCKSKNYSKIKSSLNSSEGTLLVQIQKI